MSHDNHRPKVYFLIGPSASGKSAVGALLAERIGAEILSLDSMKIYRRLDLGTAKPSPESMSRVAHHLIDIVDPSEPFNVARYVEMAERLIDEITDRGRRPLFVGGTALYLKALTEGLFEGPGQDPEIRATLRRRAEEQGSQALHDELGEVDPAAAARIHPNDLRRIVRALEVFQLTGTPISQQQTQFGSENDRHDSLIIGIRRNRIDLYDRIDRRVDRMFEAGLVEEVSALLRAGVSLSREASQALGYRELLACLQQDGDPEEARELIKRNTRRFAKRQLTWFRSFGNIQWVDVSPEDAAEHIAARIQERYFPADDE